MIEEKFNLSFLDRTEMSDSMKRILFFILVLSLVFVFFSTACKKSEETKESSSTSESLKTEPAPQKKSAEILSLYQKEKIKKISTELLPERKPVKPSTTLSTPKSTIDKLTVTENESVKVPPITKKPVEVSVSPSKEITTPLEIVVTDINKLDLNKYKGSSVVMLYFFATWCGYCREITPEIQSLYNNYKQKGFTVIGVSIDSIPTGIAAVKSYVKNNSIKYQVIIDDGSISKQYKIRGVPTFILVGKDGDVKVSLLGAQVIDVIAKDIEALI
ncbi:MAG: TlpA disulfide reductase family protein [Pseudomonadota bacterium]